MENMENLISYKHNMYTVHRYKWISVEGLVLTENMEQLNELQT